MSDPIPRLNAALEGRYRIERELGEGGMATVYLARDSKHGRHVALKVLKPELAAVVGADRFLAEIKTTANLQHPHILPLHDSGEADGLLFYVMPYVEGESLRARLDREHQLPVDEAVRIARNVAEALDYAHRHGVIHRDIKPANVLLQDGKPVISDFGIALAVGAAGGSRLTETGLSLGTPHYMSPEQATGDQHVGPATDVYALGCVLYEMLVGEPPFTGSTPQAVLGKIVTGRPVAASEDRPAVPPHVDAVVFVALEKVPADRFKSAGDFARALDRAGFVAPRAQTPDRSAVGRWRAVALTAVAGLVVAVAWVLFQGRSDGGSVVAYPYLLPAGQRVSGTGIGVLALSSDGSQFAYQADGRIFVKRMDEIDAQPLSGVERGGAPFFSPDGRELAFWFAQQIWTVPTAGGSPEAVVDVGPWFYAAHWYDPEWIIYANADGLHRVSPSGGPTETLLETEDPSDVFGPRVLPGGEWVLFTHATSRGSDRWNEAQIEALSLSTGERRTVTRGSDARYVRSGHLVYAIDDALYAIEFDPRSLETSGVPALVAQPVQRAYNPIYWSGTANYDVSETGTLAYLSQLPASQTTIVAVDREGDARPLVDLGELSVSRIRLSPDGERLVFGATAPNDIWIYDMASGDLRPITNDGTDRWPVWVGNAHVAFSSVRAGPDNVFAMRWDLADDPVQVTHHDFNHHLGVGTPDGRLVAFHSHPPGQPTANGVLDFGVSDDGSAITLRSERPSPAPGSTAAFSPDGVWMVYRLEQELYVMRSDGSGSRLQVSSGGGQWALWAETGEIFYRRGSQVVATRIQTEPDLRRVGEVILFEGDFALGAGAGNFEVTPDGQTFFMVAGSSPDDQEMASATGRLNVVVNWASTLGELFGN